MKSITDKLALFAVAVISIAVLIGFAYIMIYVLLFSFVIGIAFYSYAYLKSKLIKKPISKPTKGIVIEHEKL